MNQALFPSSFNMPIALPLQRRATLEPRRTRARRSWARHEETTRTRRLHTLLGLFGLYASSLLLIVMVSDGSDIGCLLGGIALHVLYATRRIARSWRDAAALEHAKERLVLALGLRAARS